MRVDHALHLAALRVYRAKGPGDMWEQEPGSLPSGDWWREFARASATETALAVATAACVALWAWAAWLRARGAATGRTIAVAFALISVALAWAFAGFAEMNHVCARVADPAVSVADKERLVAEATSGAMQFAELALAGVAGSVAWLLLVVRRRGSIPRI